MVEQEILLIGVYYRTDILVRVFYFTPVLSLFVSLCSVDSFFISFKYMYSRQSHKSETDKYVMQKVAGTHDILCLESLYRTIKHHCTICVTIERTYSYILHSQYLKQCSRVTFMFQRLW